MSENKYYVYYFSYPYWIYNRTCGTEQAAKEWVEGLKKQYHDAKYTINKVLKGALY
jgi:hypothetical protein